MRYPFTTFLVFAICACNGTGGTDSTTEDAELWDNGLDTQVDEVLIESVLDEETIEETGPETVSPPVPWDPRNRGYIHLRGIVHVHSLYSHDGCISNHEDVEASQRTAFFEKCLQELRKAPCESGIDFVMQTDHPGDLRDQKFEDALHFQKGDQIFYDNKGRPFANKVLCSNGSHVNHYYFYVGTEGSKQMPIAMAGPIPPEVFSTSVDINTPLEKAQAAIAMVHELGGYMFAAHTEEDNIPAERIIALPLDGMEIYNVHAGLMDVLGSHMDSFFLVDRFMAKGPDPTLVLLTFLKPLESNPKKFDKVAPHIRISHIIATDIHRNVELPALCAGGLEDGGMCENLASEYPYFAQFLVNGGPVLLSDGERIDSYRRSFRWYSNHALVTSDDPDAIREAIGKGRNYAVFDLMGMPDGFDFFAIGDGKVYEMGSEITNASQVTLYYRAPHLVAPPWGIENVTDYSDAILVTTIIKATSDGTEIVAQGQISEASFVVSEPSVWRVEIWITPKHLRPALVGVENLSESSYPYLYSNAIFIR